MDETVALAPLRARPGDAAVVVDFDGTLSPIVDDPASARSVPGAGEALVALTRRFGLVAVMSGRPTDFLRTVVPDEVVLSGLYGLEVVRGGVRTDHPAGAEWRTTVAAVARAAADTGPPGMDVEPKGLSLTLHYRRRPEIASDVTAWADAAAARSGLEARPAKMSVELHPPIAADKGTALEALAGTFRAVCYVGDDRGDLPAFDALDRMATRGVHVVRVAVASDEAPAELLGRADLVVDGPPAAVAFLRRLAVGGDQGASAPDRGGEARQ
jgi:trehalose 6-phosphate phosphatase